MMQEYNLDWIDGYVKRIKPYIHVREEDSILIKIPNQAYKLNKSGIKILKTLLNGVSINTLLSRHRDNEEIKKDIYYFFCDLKALMKGCIREGERRKAVEYMPFKLPFNKLPVLSELALTYKCNLECLFCYAYGKCKKLVEPKKEISTEQAKRIIDIIRYRAEVPSISFTGGEPALRKDLIELIEYAKLKGLWTNVITNGTLLTNGLVQGLKRAGLDSIQVSIEAENEALHDYLTNVNGSFRMTISGIRNLLGQDMNVLTNTTINRLNKDNVVRLPHFLKNLGLKQFAMNMIMPCGNALAKDELDLSYSEIGQIVLRVKEEASANSIEFYWYSPTPMCIFNPIKYKLGNKGCAACDGLLSISPSGDILPCSSYPESIGNILEEDFDKLWSSSRGLFFRNKEYAETRCKTCQHFSICNGGCPLYWQKYGYKELDNIHYAHST